MSPAASSTRRSDRTRMTHQPLPSLRPRIFRPLPLLILLAGTAGAQHYVQTNLVSNQMGQAAHQDTNLVNGWGIARSAGSPWWVSDNGTAKSTLYNGNGVAQALIVSVPGAPTGVVF